MSVKRLVQHFRLLDCAYPTIHIQLRSVLPQLSQRHVWNGGPPVAGRVEGAELIDALTKIRRVACKVSNLIICSVLLVLRVDLT